MKPTMLSEKEVVNVQPEIEQPTKLSKTCSKKRLIIGGVIGVVVLGVVVGAVLGAVYLGSEITENNYKVAWITFNNNKLKQPVQEKVVVTDREEDITNPGVVRVIADYQSKRLVIQYNGPLEGDHDATCYVSDMEDYEGDIDIKKVRDSITSFHMNVSAEIKEGHNYTTTDEEVDFNSFSPRAKEMCIGVKLVKVKPFYGSMEDLESTDDGRAKRRICKLYAVPIKICRKIGWFRICYIRYILRLICS